MNSPDMACRLSTLRARLQEHHLDGIVVVDAVNRRYLSGFTGTTGWLLITQEDAWLLTDGRYWERARLEAPEYTLWQVKGTYEDALADALASLSGHLAFEAHVVTVRDYHKTYEVHTHLTWTETTDLVESLRVVKDEEELAAIRRAAALTDEAMTRVPEILRPGMREADLAWELERYMREHGADGLAFPVTVAFGPDTATPHAEPGETALASDMPVWIDMGARIDGYCADLTRAFWYGHTPEKEYLAAWRAVRQAQVAALTVLRAGVDGRLVDAVARDALGMYGYAGAFLHNLGHGVGLAVHEGPRLSRFSEDRLVAGNVVTVEPGVYLEGRWGIRLEELAVVWDNGPEVVSAAPHWQVISPGLTAVRRRPPISSVVLSPSGDTTAVGEKPTASGDRYAQGGPQ